MKGEKFIHAADTASRLAEWAHHAPWQNYVPLWGDELVGDLRSAIAEVERLQSKLKEIDGIVRTPTPGKMGAYTHFMADFDKIRAITGR